MTEEKSLHPEFPVVSGRYQISPEWSLFLPGAFNRRIEDDDLVIWRPGFTVWIAAWHNKPEESIQTRMRLLKQDITENAQELIEEEDPGVLRLRFRLEEPADDDRVAAYYAFAVADDGYLQIAMYFDDEADAETADGVWRSISRGTAASA